MDLKGSDSITVCGAGPEWSAGLRKTKAFPIKVMVLVEILSGYLPHTIHNCYHFS